MDLIRELLLHLEAAPYSTFSMNDVPFLHADRQVMRGHIGLLLSGGLLEKATAHQLRISWEGHEFLDKVRDPVIWRKTKAGAEKVGSWSVKLLADMASGYIRIKATELGLPLG